MEISSNYQLTLQDAHWVINNSGGNMAIVTIGVSEPCRKQPDREFTCKLTGRLFHSLQPRCWLYDEILNAVSVLLRLYCIASFSTREHVITDIFFFTVFTLQISTLTKNLQLFWNVTLTIRIHF